MFNQIEAVLYQNNFSLLRFEKKVGDSVAIDEVVMEIETDKTTVGVPSPAHGIIEEIFVADGDTVKSGQQLFRLKVTGEAPKAAAPKTEAPAPAAAAPPPPPPRQEAPKPAVSLPMFKFPTAFQSCFSGSGASTRSF